jgi:hypothetical protein
VFYIGTTQTSTLEAEEKVRKAIAYEEISHNLLCFYYFIYFGYSDLTDLCQWKNN